MEKNKSARWTYRRVHGISPTIRIELRKGEKGKGKVIGATEYWPESDRSRDAADAICRQIEADARADGWSCLREETP